MRTFDQAMISPHYRVLVVDDDPAMLRILSKWLAKAGYVVRTADDGQEALDAIELECPDFLITDWEMPRLDGLELCRKVRDLLLPHYVYIVFLTVRTGAKEMIAGLENGADDFLTKPVTEGELLARMRSSSRVLELERRLSVMAHTDSLTGLLTQRSFFETLEKEWHRSRRHFFGENSTMIATTLVNEVRGMLRNGRLSQRQIARQVGLSRGTVNAIAQGKRLDPSGRRRPEDAGFTPPIGRYVRCPGCGGLAQMPCLLCHLLAARRVTYTARPRPCRSPTRGTIGTTSYG